MLAAYESPNLTKPRSARRRRPSSSPAASQVDVGVSQPVMASIVIRSCRRAVAPCRRTF